MPRLQKCDYPGKRCPNMDTYDQSCLLRIRFNCPFIDGKGIPKTKLAGRLGK